MGNPSDIILSILIPTFNEQNTIQELVGRVGAVDFGVKYEIVVVDDASIDRTYEKETLLKLASREAPYIFRLFRNRVNAGKGFSIRKGIRRARGRIIVVQDADNEYDPSEIPSLMKPILEGKVSVVFGSRFMGNRRPFGMAFPNFVANKILTWLTNVLFGLKLTDMETCYKVFDSQIVKSVPLKTNRFTFEPEITAQLAKKRIAILELPISYNGRTAKQGKKIKAKDFFFAVGILFWERLRP